MRWSIGRNDVATAVKRICEKRDQGFANLSQAWREEAECEIVTEEGQLRSEGNGNVSNEGISGRNDFAKAVKRICEKRDQVLQISHRLGERKRNVKLSQKKDN